MKILLIMLFCIAVFTTQGFSALTAEKIDEILEKVDEAIENELPTEATNQLKLILQENPRHSVANAKWMEVTGKAYVPPKEAPLPKPVYSKMSAQTNLNRDIKSIFGETRGDVLKIVKDSTKNILYDSIKELSTNAKFKKQLQEIISEAMESEKMLVLKTMRESLELPEKVEEKLSPKDTAEEYYNSAMKFLDERRYEEAKKLLEEALKLDPENEKIKKALEKMGE